MRKIIQIAAIPAGVNGYSSNSGQLFALCDDGKLFSFVLSQYVTKNPWFEIEPIPQDEKIKTHVMNDSLTSDDQSSKKIFSPWKKIFSPYCRECGQNLQLGFHNTNCPANGHDTE